MMMQSAPPPPSPPSPPPATNKVRLPDWAKGLYDRPERYHVWVGGRGGMKSSAAAITINLLCSSIPNFVACIIREFAISLGDGAIGLIYDWAKRMGINAYKPPHTARVFYPETGAYVFGLGAERNANRLRGLETVDFAWFEECQNFSETAFTTAEPTIRKPGAKILMTFNPANEEDYIYATYVVNPPPNCRVVFTNYGDVPEFRTDEMDASRQHSLDISSPDFAHIWLGELRNAKGAIFNPSKCEAAPRWEQYGRKVRAWDLAATDGGGDYTVGVMLAMRRIPSTDHREFQIQNVVRGQWSPERVRQEVYDAAHLKDGAPVEVVIENSGGEAGQQAAHMWRQMFLDKGVSLVHPTGDKITRASPVASAMNSGYISHTAGALWWPALSQELAGFSADKKQMRGRHDDQVDALAYAYNHLMSRGDRSQYVAFG